MRTLSYLVAALACVFATASVADTTLVYNADSKPLKVRVRPGAVRIDDAGPRWQLYLRAENTIYSINPKTNTFMRMDADTAKAIRKKMQALRQKIEERLATLPPKKRKIARAALAEQMPIFGNKQQDKKIKDTGRSTRVAGQKCQIKEITRGGEQTGSLCVAGRQALGMSKAEFATLTSMFELMNAMLAGTGIAYMGLPYTKLGGMPIRYSGSNGTQRTLSRISHDDLSPMVFKIPPSYEEARPKLNN